MLSDKIYLSKRKKKKLIKISITVIILIIITIFLIFKFYPTSKIGLKYKGFSETEIAWIQSLSKKEQEYFLSTEALYPLLKEKNFQLNHFTEYINFYKNNNTLSFYELVMVINQGLQTENIEITHDTLEFFYIEDFDPSRFKRYISYQKENPKLEKIKVISLVNQDIDEITMEYNETIDKFIKEKYFLKKNIKRYISHYNNNNKLNFNEIVSQVNANTDYEYYTNTKEADFTKGELILVNKYNYLDDNYIPDNLTMIEKEYGAANETCQVLYHAFKKMADDAKKENLTLYIQNAYQSHQQLNEIYTNDTLFTRPGYSEYQTGLSIDIVKENGQELKEFERTKEFKWLTTHAHEYGFILRYPKGKEKITGFNYEPWHYRYIGVETATKIKKLNITFDEYYAYYIE